MTIHIENVYVDFPDPSGKGRKSVLSDVSLHVRERETVSIVGKSGCGKTTLLNVIGGLLEPGRGRVTMENGASKSPKIGYVFQSFSLFPWMDVTRNIQIGFPVGEEDEGELKRVIDLVGLTRVEAEYPLNLSGGMAQRVALARALVSRPGIMLLDEPFSSLDAFTKMRLQDEVSKILREEGVTTILVTHDIDESIFFGDRVMIMSDEGTIRSELDVDMPTIRDRNSHEFFTIREKIYREYGLSTTIPFYFQI